MAVHSASAPHFQVRDWLLVRARAVSIRTQIWISLETALSVHAFATQALRVRLPGQFADRVGQLYRSEFFRQACVMLSSDCMSVCMHIWVYPSRASGKYPKEFISKPLQYKGKTVYAWQLLLDLIQFSLGREPVRV